MEKIKCKKCGELMRQIGPFAHTKSEGGQSKKFDGVYKFECIDDNCDNRGVAISITYQELQKQGQGNNRQIQNISNHTIEELCEKSSILRRGLKDLGVGSVTEAEIATAFFGSVIKYVDEAWPEIYEQLKEMFNDNNQFDIEDQDNAKMSLVFAVISLEIQALNNLFPDRADSIYTKALDSISSLDDREYVKQRIGLYQNKLKESTEQYMRNKNFSPLEEVAVQLIYDWFGENAKRFYVRNTTVINPFLAGTLNPILISLVGFWKNVKQSDDYK
jgi:hypothetical protein